LADGAIQETEIPLFPGILKHISVSDFPKVLNSQAVPRKYSRAAPKSAPWPVLKEFPWSRLISWMDKAEIREGRQPVLEFLLSLETRFLSGNKSKSVGKLANPLSELAGGLRTDYNSSEDL